MKTCRPNQPNQIPQDEALKELSKVLPAADRLRFAALGQVSSFVKAKQKSLVRQEKALVSRYGADSAQVRDTRRRLETESRFEVAVQVEMQRAQTEPVSRDPKALTLHGRVVNPQRLGQPGLTVSATDEHGQPVIYRASNSQGYFNLAVPASDDTKDQNVTLLVSNESQAVLYRGRECFARKPGAISYRQLIIGTADPEEQPAPPPEIDPKSVIVPDVRGLDQDTAEAQIGAVGLTVKSTTKESEDQNVGRVIDQKPAPGAKVRPCTRIDIVVGAAKPKVSTPNVVELTLKEAQTAISKEGLVVGTVRPEGASSESRVIRQSPKAGEQVALRTPVDLVTREPSPKLTVPGVIGSKLHDARKAVTTAGFKVGAIKPPQSAEGSTVIEQRPAPGTQADGGSPVDLTTQKEAAPMVSAPKIVELPLAAARETLKKSKLTVGQIDPPDSSESGIVVEQKPSADTSVPEGSSVDIRVKAPPTEPDHPETAKSRKSKGEDTAKPGGPKSKAKSKKENG